MRILFLALAICLFLHSRAQKEPPINSGEIILQCDQLYDSGDYKKALQLYGQIVRNDTNYVSSLYGRALSCEADSQYAKAFQYCEEALSLPDQRGMEPKIYNIYGNILSDLNRKDGAITIFNKTIQKYPAYGLLYFNKGLVYMYQEKYVEAEACFKQSLMVDPYVYSAHFYLGLTAINEGKIIPGMLSLTGYLLLNPGGKYAGRAIKILDLIANSKDEIIAYKNNRKEEPDSNFASIEEIVLSKIALEKGYKPLLELDDPISRQIQVVFEKMELKSGSVDFWMQYYLPFFKSTFNSGKFELFINWIFENVNIKSIKEYNKKNKKSTEAYTSEVLAYFNLIRATREPQADKRSVQTSKFLFDNDVLLGKGVVDAKGNLLGSWEFYYPGGNLKSIGQFNDAGKRTGTWTFYFQNGKLKSRESYQNGSIDGETFDNFENGIEASRETYDKGKLNGPSVSYYWPGTPKKMVGYKLDEPEGIVSEFYSNGLLRSQGNYINGKLEGPYTDYFRSGAVKDKMIYKSGSIQGNYQTFYENGNLESEGLVTNGKTEGPWKYYFESGNLKMKRNFISDNADGMEEEYYENAVLSSTQMYKKGKLEGLEVDYDKEGKRYCQVEYSGDLPQSIRFYNKDGKVISHGERATDLWEQDIYKSDGSKWAHEIFDRKGLLTGTKTFYFPSGAVNQTVEYRNGLRNGVVTTYYRNGQKKSVQDWVDNKEDGHYIGYFKNGQVQSEGWIRNGSAQGPWIFYDELGNKSTESYFQDGELSGYRSEYAPDGKITFEEHYYKGWITQLTQFDSSGRILIRDSFPQESGKYLLLYPSGSKWVETTMSHGDFDGSYTTYYFDGSIESSRFYKKGIQDSSFISYYYGGAKKTIGQYRNGINSGTWNDYDIKGTLTGSMVYNKDGIRRLETYYFPGGKKDFEIPFKNDDRDGLAIKYDPDDVPAYAIRYDEGDAISYTYPGSDNNWVPEIKFLPGLFAVRANFANGRPSRRCTFEDGKLTGMDTLFYNNGKIRSIDSSAYGENEGRQVFYTITGQLKSESVSRNDNIHGIAREYFDDGKLAKETPHFNGTIHGVEKIYNEQGDVVENRVYYYGKLVTVKK